MLQTGVLREESFVEEGKFLGRQRELRARSSKKRQKMRIYKSWKVEKSRVAMTIPTKK